MSQRNCYTFHIDFNLYHEIYDNYYLRTDLDVVNIEIDSESFFDYKECIDDCSALLLNFKNYMEEITDFKIMQAWEPNPMRNKDVVVHASLTKPEDWKMPEILHIFLFAKTEEDINESTTPIAKCYVMVEEYNKDFIPFVH